MDELNKFPSGFVADQFTLFLDEKEIDLVTESLAHTLSHAFAGKELVIIGLLKGSSFFLADLVRKIHDVKVIVDFVKLKAIGRTDESPGTISIAKDISVDIRGKNVLIIKEIIDTGRAIHFLKNHLQQSEPEKIEVLTMLDKPYQRVVPLSPDYVGKQIDEQFVVGYGMDLDQFGRNFSGIYTLNYPN